MSVNLTTALQNLGGRDPNFVEIDGSGNPIASRQSGMVLLDTASITWSCPGPVYNSIQATAVAGDEDVTSVFGRTGAVVAATGDYTAAQVTNAPDLTASNNFTGASQTISAANPSLTFVDTAWFNSQFNIGVTGQAAAYLFSAGLHSCITFSQAVQNTVLIGSNIGDASGILVAGFITVGVGAQLTAASTITPTNSVHHVTGATAIETITVPAGVGAGWQFTLIPDSAGVTGITGNIALASTLVLNKALTLTWDGTKFYPSY
jgi:hypothetical protein